MDDGRVDSCQIDGGVNVLLLAQRPGQGCRYTGPSAGLAELARVTPPDGAVLATVFSTTSHDPARDQIDPFAQDADWQIPAWYTELKTTAVPIIGSLRWRRGRG
jgi:hypothetical protein